MSALHIEPRTANPQTRMPAAPDRVELAEREFDGVSVSLTWTRGTDVVSVTVDDARTGDHFELVVAENERALDLFHHPFAHAHARGIELAGDPEVGVAVD